MFEFQVNHKRLPSDHISDDIKVLFKDFDADVKAVSLMQWEEHCTECALPNCYNTCALYQKRKDGKCRRFVDGFSAIPDAPNYQNYLVRVVFKRWGELMAYANARMIPVRRARLLEKSFFFVDHLLERFPDSEINNPKGKCWSARIGRLLKVKTLRSKLLTNIQPLTPDYFLLEVYNPGPKTVNLSLTVRNMSEQGRKLPFLDAFKLEPGFHRKKVPFVDILKRVNPNENFQVIFNPNLADEKDEPLELYFGTLGFINDTQFKKDHVTTSTTGSKEKNVKVVVWDLDNTVWDGILVESDTKEVTLKPGVADIIKELDRRGIVNSIASKNDHEPAMAKLKSFGLDSYFVFPQISWNPKSSSLAAIVKDFNVGADTVVFIDDSPFEREEVGQSNKKLRIFDAADYQNLLDKPEFNPPQTTEASKRRQYYQNQKQRSDAEQDFSGGYGEFLRECAINIEIEPGNEANVDRIHELVTRTNQMNFSTNRYTKDELRDFLSSDEYDCFSVRCNDKFGDYGMIGFCIIDKNTTQIVDMMFSCRVQAKQVEHALFMFLMHHYKAYGSSKLSSRFRPTDRNQQVAKVFDDLQFTLASSSDDQRIYEFNLEAALPTQDIIQVHWQGQPWAS